MTAVGIATLILIIVNIFCSLQGLLDRFSFERNNFEINKILLEKEYRRLLTSGFFHVNGIHLILNMSALFFFSTAVESSLGEARYLLIYFAALVGGNLFSLVVHRYHVDYSAAAGASGAVSGIIFATIALFPGFEIGLFGKNLPIPGWLFAFLYVLFSMYGIKSKKDNIGHETQLAGGLTGLVIALLIQPAAIENNYLAILAVSIPSVVFIFITNTNPRLLLIDNKFYDLQKKKYEAELIIRSEGIDHQQEIDLILEKIHQNGIRSLTRVEGRNLIIIPG